MADVLTPDTVAAWLARFSAFGDAVIRSVSVEEHDAGRVATLVADAQDGDAGGRWVRVTLTIEEVSEFRIIQGPSDYMVIFDLNAQITHDSAEISQDGHAWFIRGSRASWSTADTQ